MTSERFSRRRSLLLATLATVGVLVLLEGLLSWAYALSDSWRNRVTRGTESRHAVHDPELGWAHRPGLALADMYGRGRDFTTNAQGFRAGEDYTSAVPLGQIRAVFLGDSFTMGLGVDDSQTIPALVEAMDPTIQSINMGMAGYGLGQCYLWYLRDGVALDADLLVFSLIGHDFVRLMEDHFMAPKPRLELVNGELVARNTPVPRSMWGPKLRRAFREFRQRLAIARLLRRGVIAVTPAETGVQAQEGEAGRHGRYGPVARKIFEELAQLEPDMPLLLVYLPTEVDLDRPVGRAEWAGVAAQELGIAFVDLTPEFARLSRQERAEAFRGNHYSESGNRLVAEHLLLRIRALAAPAAQTAPGVAPGTTPPTSDAAGGEAPFG